MLASLKERSKKEKSRLLTVTGSVCKPAALEGAGSISLVDYNELENLNLHTD